MREDDVRDPLSPPGFFPYVPKGVGGVRGGLWLVRLVGLETHLLVFEPMLGSLVSLWAFLREFSLPSWWGSVFS